jgi:ParB/RepB/Spo0J family partition protein
MDLEFHQIDLRYETLRLRDPRREQQLAASILAIGQQAPVVVVHSAGQIILVDGFKRLRALKRLKHDTVQATTWDLEEREALLLGRLMRTTAAESPMEQGWLLRELKDRFGMGQEELARRFDRTAGWVSRRIALIRNLPEDLQKRVRDGQIASDTAMKVLVPLSRDNRRDSLVIGEAIARAHLSTRQAQVLYAGWRRGNAEVRERILADPVLFLRAREAAQAPNPGGKSDLRMLFDDLGVLGATARRASKRIQEGALLGLLPLEAQELEQALKQVQADCQALFTVAGKEPRDARQGPTDRHPAA